jgi:DNA-binding ferritin-like protein
MPPQTLASIVHMFLTVQIQVKTFHWQTYSYSKHKTSDSIYEDFIDKTDEFVEVFMGQQNKRVDFSKIHRSISLKNISEKDMIRILKRFGGFLSSLKDLTTDLQNLRDEMLGIVHRGLYLLSLK